MIISGYLETLLLQRSWFQLISFVIFILECQVLDSYIIRKMRYIPCAQFTKLVHIWSISFVTTPINMFYMCGLINLGSGNQCAYDASIFDLQFCILFWFLFFFFFGGWINHLSCLRVIQQDVNMIFSWILYSFYVDKQPSFWVIKYLNVYIYFHSFSFYFLSLLVIFAIPPFNVKSFSKLPVLIYAEVWHFLVWIFYF